VDSKSKSLVNVNIATHFGKEMKTRGEKKMTP